MGLDWNPTGKPRAGFEDEFSRIFRELDADAAPKRGLARILKRRGLTESERKARMERLGEISDPAYALLGAPRVGHDVAADRWLRERLQRAGKLDGYDKAREEMRGYCVLDLLAPCDGFPSYSNYGAYEGLERFSFRGSFLQDVEDVLGAELMGQAYERMLPGALQVYGTKLLERGRRFARANGVERVEHEPPSEFVEGSAAARADIIFSAARWCLFWAQRGHGMEPWF